MSEKVRVQTGDIDTVLNDVWRHVQERMRRGSEDINVLLDDGESALNDAIEKLEAGDLRAASDCAASAASCALLVALAMHRMAEDVPAKKEMN
ncbi:hypothetical protein JUN65_01925 [Gluconacetobacter azotocaptans]|uniref:hypothetical protein n=1 Tax=Gluconacetobacter azotocaptans TaxID=142834 RepID=UPI00195EFD5F|nr:hypothetical protein [Gluconacetobacter azotocaptans]MBM9400351.1 hypothetical protein [Gluconacetobacter azotocaptans]